MKKINRLYYSIWDVLGLGKKIQDAPTGYTEDGYHYHDGANADRVVVTRGHVGYYDVFPKHQFLGALYHFAKMGKALSEAFKPYQSSGKIKRDLLQPVNGVINIAKGLVILVFSLLAAALWTAILPFALLLSLCLLPICLLAMTAPFFVKAIYPISWFIEGLTTVIRGVAQVGCTPLAYLFELPFRGAMTFSGSLEVAEDKPEIQRLVTEAEGKIKSLVSVSEVKGMSWDDVNLAEREAASLLFEIQRKYSKSVNEGWHTRHDSLDIAAHYTSYSSFFPAFKAAAEKPYQWRAETKYPPKIANETQKEALAYLEFYKASGRRDPEERDSLLRTATL